MKTVIDTLSMGGAISWVDALERMTGSSTLYLSKKSVIHLYNPILSSYYYYEPKNLETTSENLVLLSTFR